MTGVVMILMGIAYPLAATFANKSTVLLLMIVAAAAAWDCWRCRRFPLVTGSIVPLACLALIVWGAASIFWEATDGLAIKKAAQLLSIGLAVLVALAGICLVNRRDRHRAFLTLLVGTAIVLAFLFSDRVSGCAVQRAFFADARLYPNECQFFRYKPGMTLTMLALAPCMMACWANGHRLLGLALATLVVGGVLAAGTHTAALALGLGVLLYVLLGFLPRLGTWLVCVVLVAALTFAPIVVSYFPAPRDIAQFYPEVPSSLRHRLLIWQFVADKIDERTVFGWGLDAARELPGSEQNQDIYLNDGDKLMPVPQSVLPLHPHNLALQLWLEMGGVGVVLYSAVLILLVRHFSRLSHPANRSAGLVLMVMVMTIGFGSFGMWQSWWVGGIAWTAIFALMQLGRPLAAGESR